MLLQVDKSRFLLLSFLCLRKSLAMDYSTHETTLKSISFHLTDVRARARVHAFLPIRHFECSCRTLDWCANERAQGEKVTYENANEITHSVSFALSSRVLSRRNEILYVR